MFSRFHHSLTRFIRVIFGHFIQASVKQIESIIKKRIMEQPNGVTIVNLVPRHRVVIVSPNKMAPSIATQLLRAVMYPADKNARRPYDYLPFLTGLPNFLSGEDITMRKKHIVPYLHFMKSRTDYVFEMNKLLLQLHENNRLKDPISVKNIISNHLQSLFTRALLGINFPEPIKNIMLQIEQSPYLLIFGLLPPWAIRLLPLLPPIHKLRRHYNNAIKNFLVEQIEFIKNTEEKDERNWLTRMVLEKVGDIRLISKKEIEALAEDPEIRMPIALMLGTSNLTRVVQALFTHLFLPDKQETIGSLILEASQYKLTDSNLLSKEKMPFLHATYLEAVRKGLEGFSIPRSIHRGITVGHIEIPPNSFVFFNLDAMFHMGSTRYPAATFAPERFINDQGQLIDHIKLHDGWFTPFGIGKRMCPGFQVSELIIKKYLVTFIGLVKCFHPTTVEFYDEKQYTAKSIALVNLKRSIKQAFFKPKDSKEGREQSLEAATNKISEMIIGYICK